MNACEFQVQQIKGIQMKKNRIFWTRFQNILCKYFLENKIQANLKNIEENPVLIVTLTIKYINVWPSGKCCH
jgi:hypothetical protein